MTRKVTRKQELFAHIQVPEGLPSRDGNALKSCAICGGNEVGVIYLQAHFPVVRCRACGLVYADEHFKLSDLEAFYSGDYYQRAYVCHPAEIDSKIARDYLDAFRVVDGMIPGGRMVDFGSARGTFLESLIASDMGPKWEVEGIDINRDEIAMGRARGIPVREASLFDGALAPSSYEAITAFSVLEHMQDPRATLEALRAALVPAGKLLLIVPNGDCLIIKLGLIADRLGRGRFRQFTDNVFHEEHLYYFSPKTMTRILEMTGFRVKHIGFQPSYLETHPPGIFVAAGAYALRGLSFLLRRQTMLLAIAEKAD